MGAWELPKTAVVNGHEYAIRSDFRAVLDVMTVLGDQEISDRERGAVASRLFYPDFEEMPASDHAGAIEFMMWFTAGGDTPTSKPKGKLADWGQDFSIIVAPVNRVLGYEVREVPYLHWWTFLAAYYEIGDCLFAHVVSIRMKKQKGKKLDKFDEEFYREHRDLVDMRKRVTPAEEEELEQWIKG